MFQLLRKVEVRIIAGNVVVADSVVVMVSLLM